MYGVNLNVSNSTDNSGTSIYSNQYGTGTSETIMNKRGVNIYENNDASRNSNVTQGMGEYLGYTYNGEGTVTNSYGIHVNNIGSGLNTIAYRVYLNDVIGTTAYGFYQYSNDSNFFAGRIVIGIVPAASNQLQLSAANAAKLTTNTWTIVSDERLKAIERKYEKGLKEIMALNPINYHNKNVPDKKLENSVLETQGVGFSAQEVQKVFPEALGTDKDGYLNLNIHSILIAQANAIKELKAEIEKLMADMELLKGEKKRLNLEIEPSGQ